jgi:hypothetical protein
MLRCFLPPPHFYLDMAVSTFAQMELALVLFVA